MAGLSLVTELAKIRKELSYAQSKYYEEVNQLRTQHAAANAELNRLKEALAHYASPDNWSHNYMHWDCVDKAGRCGPDYARAALKEKS